MQRGIDEGRVSKIALLLSLLAIAGLVSSPVIPVARGQPAQPLSAATPTPTFAVPEYPSTAEGLQAEEFLHESGAYSYLVVALLSFLLGTFSRVIADFLKGRKEKARLIDLFVADIQRNWGELDRLQSAPVGSYWVRIRTELKGVKAQFTGEPEYEFEVHNLRLFETEGFKLVQYLGRKARKEFWEVYSLIRDAEAVRQVIKSLPADHKDRSSYQRVFVELIIVLSEKFSQLALALDDERPHFFRWIL